MSFVQWSYFSTPLLFRDKKQAKRAARKQAAKNDWRQRAAMGASAVAMLDKQKGK